MLLGGFHCRINLKGRPRKLAALLFEAVKNHLHPFHPTIPFKCLPPFRDQLPDLVNVKLPRPLVEFRVNVLLNLSDEHRVLFPVAQRVFGD